MSGFVVRVAPGRVVGSEHFSTWLNLDGDSSPSLGLTFLIPQRRGLDSPREWYFPEQSRGHKNDYISHRHTRHDRPRSGSHLECSSSFAASFLLLKPLHHAGVWWQVAHLVIYSKPRSFPWIGSRPARFNVYISTGLLSCPLPDVFSRWIFLDCQSQWFIIDQRTWELGEVSESSKFWSLKPSLFVNHRPQFCKIYITPEWVSCFK